MGALTDESDGIIFYSCALCQSYAPNHVVHHHTRASWSVRSLQLARRKAAYEMNPIRRQPSGKKVKWWTRARQWKGINDFIEERFHGAFSILGYSMIEDP